MSLYKNNDLGQISISNSVFASIFDEACHSMTCRGRVWPSTRKGRQIGSETKINTNEIANNIEVSFDESYEIFVTVNIIIKFGTSIKKTTDFLGDYIANAIEEFTGKKPIEVKIRITGVKSRQLAKRNTEVIKRYGIDG